MSCFRAEHIINEEFIRLQEADFLNHWLWGTFRFLSGDDKSTWYTLLKYGVRMTYVPDANGTTIEVVEGNGYRRMVENLRRWSGNMLRNGARAIVLGPTQDAVLHLVVPDRPAARHVDDAVFAGARDRRRDEGRHGRSSAPTSSTSRSRA